MVLGGQPMVLGILCGIAGRRRGDFLNTCLGTPCFTSALCLVLVHRPQKLLCFGVADMRGVRLGDNSRGSFGEFLANQA